MAIYQRNIIASLVKYILLKDILQKLDTSPLTDTYKGVFSSMLKRLQEIIFECVLTAFNGSNYDNYLICNNLIIILTKLNEKITLSISTVKIVVKTNLTRFQSIRNAEKKKN
jgi:hypothetical protein